VGEKRRNDLVVFRKGYRRDNDPKTRRLWETNERTGRKQGIGFLGEMAMGG